MSLKAWLPRWVVPCAAALTLGFSACADSDEPIEQAVRSSDSGGSRVSPATTVADRHAPQMRTVSANGIRMRIAEMGSGPLVIFLHGFPESGYSWRHHLTALAAAGFHAVAPDLRGYGETDKPTAVEDYDIHHLTADVVGLIAGHWVQQERPDETNAVLIRFLKEVATPAGVLTAR